MCSLHLRDHLYSFDKKKSMHCIYTVTDFFKFIIQKKCLVNMNLWLFSEILYFHCILVLQKMPVKLPHDKKYSKKNVYSYRILKQYIIIFFSYDLTYVAIAPFTHRNTNPIKSIIYHIVSIIIQISIYTQHATALLLDLITLFKCLAQK